VARATLTSPWVGGLLRRGSNRRTYVGYAVALGAVSLVSLVIGFVLGQVNLANVSMLYLIAVMGTAVAFGRGPAVFASLTAFLIFDWFFVEPVHQFSVANPGEWVSLVFFLLTATVTANWLPVSVSARWKPGSVSARPSSSMTWCV
jgi:K+-sensing histidine kinase KdpD